MRRWRAVVHKETEQVVAKDVHETCASDVWHVFGSSRREQNDGARLRTLARCGYALHDTPGHRLVGWAAQTRQGMPKVAVGPVARDALAYVLSAVLRWHVWGALASCCSMK